MKQKYCLVVYSNPIAGRDEEFNRWYDDIHLADVLAVPGFLSARRFSIANPKEPKVPHRYMALYEIETDDLKKTLAELRQRAGSAAMPLDDSIDLRSVWAMCYKEIARAQDLPIG